MSKRRRVAAAAEEMNDAALITSSFDLLMQAPRKQLARLLKTILEGCPSKVLQRMQVEAKAMGIVADKPSRLQQASPAILESVFAFLSPRDLSVAESACLRWRSLCKHGVGWLSLLSRGPLDELWLREMYRHRLTPANFHQQHFVVEDAAVLATVGAQLPCLTSVDLCDVNPQMLASYVSPLTGCRHLEHIQLHLATFYEPEPPHWSRPPLLFDQIDAFSMALSAQLKVLDVKPAAFNCLSALTRFSELHTLTIELDDPLPKAVHFPALTALSIFSASSILFPASWAPSSSLRRFSLACPTLTSDMVRDICAYRELVQLSLDWVVGSPDFELLSSLDNLRDLKLWQPSCVLSSLKVLPRLHRLTNFTVGLIGANECPLLKPLVNLSSLMLGFRGGGYFTDLGLSSLAARFHQLTKLELVNADNLSSAGIKWLGKFAKLERVVLRFCRLSRSTKKAVARLREQNRGLVILEKSEDD